MSIPKLTILVSICLASPLQATEGARGIEIGEDDVSELPGGKEADGIQGDFVLRNAHIEALISGALPGRKANMVTHYDAETQGCLYDLCLAGSRNDQLTLLAPGSLQGPVSSVALRQGEDGREAEVIVERTAARGRGQRERHRYILSGDARHLLVISEYSLEGKTEWNLRPEPLVKGLLDPRTFGGISFADAMNPSDRQGYAWAPVKAPGAEPGWEPATLQKGQQRVHAIAVAPGRSPAEAFGVIAALRGETGRLQARLHEKGRGIASARLQIWLDDASSLPAYPDTAGKLEVLFPPGTYRYAASDIGRPILEGTFLLEAGKTADLDLAMGPRSGISFEVTDAAVDGKKSPCKAQVISLGLTPALDLGVPIQAHGCKNQYHAENGWFTVPAPPGDYRVIITRGIEYDPVVREVKVSAGKESLISARLRRVVDSTGHVSTDFHSHSTPSGDNYCGTDDRVINLAAEQIEFAPTTEHNRLHDWTPNIARLGLSEEITTVVGIELTGPGAHLNSFPFKVDSWVQDNGAPVWQRDPRVNALALRNLQGGGPERWVQINHPNVGEFFRDRNADGVLDGGHAGLESLIDAAEVWSGEILNPSLWLTRKDTTTGKESRYQNRTLAWLQLLNQGRFLNCVAVSDAHSVFGNGAGGWRTYVPSSTDEPSRIDAREIVRNARAGRMVVTNGPYLEVRLDDGTLPGGHARRSGSCELEIKVQCASGIEIDRVQVLVNGRKPEALSFTRAGSPGMFGKGVIKFQQRIPLPLTEDAHLIVAALGEHHTLRTLYGDSWQAGMKPCAFSNPIFVDVDGGGFRANGDLLDHPLATAKE